MNEDKTDTKPIAIMAVINSPVVPKSARAAVMYWQHCWLYNRLGGEPINKDPLRSMGVSDDSVILAQIRLSKVRSIEEAMAILKGVVLHDVQLSYVYMTKVEEDLPETVALALLREKVVCDGVVDGIEKLAADRNREVNKRKNVMYNLQRAKKCDPGALKLVRVHCHLLGEALISLEGGVLLASGTGNSRDGFFTNPDLPYIRLEREDIVHKKPGWPLITQALYNHYDYETKILDTEGFRECVKTHQ